MKDVKAFLAEYGADIKWIRKTLDEHNAQTADLAQRVGKTERLLYIGLGVVLTISTVLPFVLYLIK